MKWRVAAVAVLSLAVLGVRARNAGIAAGYLDPVSRIDAQDEALYAHSAIRMAEGRGGWLTPVFMGRYGLYKPPLLMWAAAASVKLFGWSALALRLPSLLAAALAACLVWLWLARVRGRWAAAAGVLLLLSNRLWQVVGGMALTDGLLAAATVAAVYCLFIDPRLKRRAPFFGFAAATAAGVLAKSVAGLMPLLVLLLYAVLARAEHRPSARRMAHCALLAAALAAPWFVYNAAAHPRWFWAEHVGLEIFAFGAGAPPQTSQDNHLWFYARRLALTDPFLCAAALFALPWFAAALLRKRPPAELLLACWLAVVLAAALLWQYRNALYLLPALPALAIVAAAYGPLFTRAGGTGLAVLAVVFALKTNNADRPWSLSFAREAVPPAKVLADYCRMRRANDLVIVDPDDAFYATLLPLARVRYCYLAPDVPASRYRLDFRGMGIMVTAGEFDDLARHEPVFRDRLRQWGLDSPEPVGTVILARDADEIARMLAAHPESDFLVPSRLGLLAGAHSAIPEGDRTLLLSRQPGKTTSPSRPCAL